MGSIWELVRDATLPVMSYFSGRRFNETIKQAIPADIQIEDLWIPFFCITTNVSKHRYMIHRQGCLWKAVRASMSLMEYLPPMLIDGDLLVDGGYLNNLPGDVMRDTFRPAFVIGVDVEGSFSEDLYNVTTFGDDLSGFWICYRRFLGMISPFTPRLRMPKFNDLVSAVEYMNNTRNIQNLRESGDLDLYIKPKLANTNLLDYHKLDQIEKIGFDAAEQQLTDNLNRIPKAFLLPSWELEEDLLRRSMGTPPPVMSPGASGGKGSAAYRHHRHHHHHLLHHRQHKRGSGSHAGELLSTSAPRDSLGLMSLPTALKRSKSHEAKDDEEIKDILSGNMPRSMSGRRLKERAVGFKEDSETKGMTKGQLSRSFGALTRIPGDGSNIS
uniref:PNPLA domain-containing protein n=1 Tax=Lotharella globosa TaxID=91324 RepID=A0A7S3YYP1_9EUKA